MKLGLACSEWRELKGKEGLKADLDFMVLPLRWKPWDGFSLFLHVWASPWSSMSADCFWMAKWLAGMVVSLAS